MFEVIGHTSTEFALATSPLMSNGGAYGVWLINGSCHRHQCIGTCTPPVVVGLTFQGTRVKRHPVIRRMTAPLRHAKYVNLQQILHRCTWRMIGTLTTTIPTATIHWLLYGIVSTPLPLGMSGGLLSLFVSLDWLLCRAFISPLRRPQKSKKLWDSLRLRSGRWVYLQSI